MFVQGLASARFACSIVATLAALLLAMPAPAAAQAATAVFVDANLYRKFGVEAEARMFRFNESEQVHDTTYLIGPRFSYLGGRFRPYGKLLVGRGDFYFPFHYAKGTYFVVAPGFGIDWHPRRGRLAIRVVDFEMQYWPNFSYGSTLQPYGVSSGIAVRVF
jgi:hypothetical protein